jgi:hypothetical protein
LARGPALPCYPHLAPPPVQAMSLMLPHAGRNPFDDGTLEGHSRGLSSGGYLAVARSSAELGGILDKIKVRRRVREWVRVVWKGKGLCVWGVQSGCGGREAILGPLQLRFSPPRQCTGQCRRVHRAGWEIALSESSLVASEPFLSAKEPSQLLYAAA